VLDDVDAARKQNPVVFRSVQLQHEHATVRDIAIEARGIRREGLVEVRLPLRAGITINR
jgi:hypothetical protein